MQASPNEPLITFASTNRNTPASTRGEIHAADSFLQKHVFLFPIGSRKKMQFASALFDGSRHGINSQSFMRSRNMSRRDVYQEPTNGTYMYTCMTREVEAASLIFCESNQSRASRKDGRACTAARRDETRRDEVDSCRRIQMSEMSGCLFSRLLILYEI